MKALILAAGFGTRLAPHTQRVPKALFEVAGTPLLGRMLANLKRAGCSSVAVNTHHLADQIRAYLSAHDVGLPVTLSHEPKILGTGGAVRQLADFWDAAPFIVVNADILTDIDLAAVYACHLEQKSRATLVMHDRPPFNQVWVDGDNRITGFARFSDSPKGGRDRKMAFTGIQVLDADILRYIPDDGFCDIISVYRQMIDEGLRIRAHVVHGHYWQDVGTPERYRDAVVDTMAPEAFRSAFPGRQADTIDTRQLTGDGSDRKWYRLTAGEDRLVLVDHGITTHLPGSEVNAFVSIGTHLYARGLPVPQIIAHDGFSGLVFMQDLGDRHLQQVVREAGPGDRVESIYRGIIDTLIDLTARAARGFDPSWTCQTSAYDVDLVLDKECRYFVDAFLKTYLNMSVAYSGLEAEFMHLARGAVDNGVNGLIHRDFQSRNIMIKDGRHYLIDFQGARFGPVQYDLAALLIDPYVDLESDLRQRLLDYAVDQAVDRLGCSSDRFVEGYRYCAVTRNLQMLGAFGFLSRIKHKPDFERWIPIAAPMLAGHLYGLNSGDLPELTAIAEKIGSRRH
jgi:aminoglycoside/choline kinase family phosphotransferase/choline kinase